MMNPTLTHLELCTYCPKMCRFSCPVTLASGREALTPQAKMAGLNQIRKGNEPWTPETTEPLWACTGCRHCSNYCTHGVQPGATLFAGRAEAMRRGVGHHALARYPERFRARDERLAKRAREILPKERFAEEARVGFWPGCDAIDKGAGDVLAQLRLFDRIGAEHVRLVQAERMCGGYPLLAAGHPDVFRWHALRVAAELSRYGTVVMNCSACVYALRALYPAEGIHLPVEILHVSEYLESFVARVKPTRAENPRVYYHDPCYLARYQNTILAPRKLLARVADVREFAWSKGDTECCGGGGLLPKTMPSVADEMARRRLREVAAEGGGIVATGCATCKHMLARNAPSGVIVKDLATVIEELSRNVENSDE
ncbi:MAG: (Fe-S)-binding protein [Deltaproteobacteria bacterium]|nr:(Fe-S)-binding protein [Deltaproteobacteria bacterium]